MINPTKEDKGRKVIYTGNTHPGGEVEEGIITSFNENVVFVRYGAKTHSEATSRSDLEWVHPNNDLADAIAAKTAEFKEKGLGNFQQARTPEQFEAYQDAALAFYEDLLTPRHISEWDENDGAVLWWTFPISEPPYLGSPLSCGHTVEMRHYVGGEGEVKTISTSVGGWPGYREWWTPLPSNAAIGLVEQRIKAAIEARK